MPQVKGMRWSTAVAMVAAGVEAHIAQKTAEANDARSVLYLLKRIGPPDARVPGITESVKSRPTKGRIAPGSIPDRVLEIVGEFDAPCTMAQILEAKHGATNSLITAQVRALVRSGHLVAIGGPRSRRYHLPTTKARRSA